jgi:hypothetical protein
MSPLLLSLILAGQPEYRRPVPCEVQAEAALALAKAKREREAPKAASSSPYVSPPGYHRHIFSDGTVIEHSDDSKNDIAAHTRNGETQWSKYSGPLPPTVKSEARKIVRWKKVCHGNWCEMVPVYETK